MNTVRWTALLCALLLLLCALLSSCEEQPEKDPTPEVVSDRAIEFFTEALKNYNSRAFYGNATATVVVNRTETTDEGGKNTVNEGVFRQYFTVLHRADLSPQELYFTSDILVPNSEEQGAAGANRAFCFDCRVKGDDCVYTTAEGGQEQHSFSSDALSKLGVPSVEGRAPGSVFAMSDGKQISINFRFSAKQCDEAQSPFLNLINNFFLGGDRALVLSDMQVTALLNAEDKTFISFDFSFNASPDDDRTVTYAYSYSETFDRYGTKDEIIHNA